MPVDPALNIIKDLLEQDTSLCDRTVLSVQNIIKLLGFFLLNTHFSFQHLGLPLDLMKSIVMDESLSVFNQSSVLRIIIVYYAIST